MSNNNKENEQLNQPYEIQQLMDCGIKIHQLPKLLEQMFNANLNLFIWGYMGLGKTASIEQFVAKQRQTNKDFGYYYFPLASMLAEDLTGIPMPYKDDETGMNRTAYAVPKNLPTDPNGVGVLVFDEFNNASPSVQNAVQQLIQERRIGDYILPNGYWIVAMGNQTGVNAYSNEIQAPVKDRFAHIYLEPNVDDWVDYILGLPTNETNDQPFMAGITPSKIRTLVAGFVKSHSDYLFDTKEYNLNSYTFATPRSWERVIKLYSANLDATETEVRRFASMYLGKGVANLLVEYLQNSHKYQDPKDILIQGLPFKDNKDFNGFIGTLVGCISYIAQADNNDKQKLLSNLFESGLKLPNTDWQVIVAKMVSKKPTIKPYIDRKYIVKISELVDKTCDESIFQ